MKRYYINNNWKYQKGYFESYLNEYHEEFTDIRIPHSVTITPFNYFDESIYQMVSTYQRKIFVPESYEGKCLRIVFEAAAHDAKVYLNGKLLIRHEGGYTAFSADISEELRYGEDNLVCVILDSREDLNFPPFGKVIDYMTYGGIYRDVYLEVGEKSHIEDVFVTTEIKNGIKVSLDIKATIDGDTKSYVYNQNGELIYESTLNERTLNLKDVTLWSLDEPVLYQVVTELYEGEKLVDSYEVTTGFRQIDFKADGLYLNGKKVHFRGLDRHQSYPYVGYAMPESMQRNDARIMKYELGLNAVRTSHYPQSHYFLDECDRIGLLAFMEIPGWQHIGDDKWKEVALRHTQEMVLQYRNHPSIFLWGVRINESVDDDAFYEKTNEIAHKLDPSRPTSGVRYLQKSSLKEDVFAFNEFVHSGNNEGVLDPKKNTPDLSKGYFISEYCGHMFPTKAYDDEKHRTELLKRHARILNDANRYEKIAGTFGWCLFDYNTHQDFGSGDSICYHGVCDFFRNRKDVAELYRSLGLQDTILHVTSNMDIGDSAAGVIEEIYAITNADCIRLYKNDAFVKEYDHSNSPFGDLGKGPILIDDRIGELLVKKEGFGKKKADDVKALLLAANRYGLANLPFKYLMLALKCITIHKMKMEDAVELYGKYISNWGDEVTAWKFEAIKDGKVVKTIVKKPMKSCQLAVDVSSRELIEGRSYDVAAVRVRVLSDDGNVLPYFNEPVEYLASGAIEVIGPVISALRGGMGGTYVKSKAIGSGQLIIRCRDMEDIINFDVKDKKDDQM